VRVLVVGEPQLRGELVRRLEGFQDVAEGDPALGNVANLIRVEGDRFDAIVFAGKDDPLTVEALGLVKEKAVVLDAVPEAGKLRRLVRQAASK
jgi:hypothetical protein